MKVIEEWKNVCIQGEGTGLLRLEERAGHYWVALYKKLSAGDNIQEKMGVAVEAIKENPEAAAGAALTAAANGTVKAALAALGVDTRAARGHEIFENDSAKGFSKTFEESNNAALRNHLLFEKELSRLTSYSNSGNTVSMTVDRTYRVVFENPWSGENMSREFLYELERIREKLESSRIKQGIDWTLDINGLLTIKGRGTMPDWYSDGAVDTPWYPHRTSIKRAYISDGFTNIGEYTFEDCGNLTYVRIPNSVTEIGASSFAHCSSLRNIDIPNSVSSIGAHAFGDCANLTSIRIPWRVTKLAWNVFSDCKSLTEVRIPSGVTTIDSFAFDNCCKLSRIEIPNSVTKIESFAFYRCSNLISINIPNNVTSIDESAFEECDSLTQIRIPQSVTKLGTGVFKKCKNLKKVEMPSRFDSPLFKLRFGISKDIVTFI